MPLDYRSIPARRCVGRARHCEPLERRLFLATYTVTTTADGAAGTLRQAILDANANPGPDAIRFAVAGVIRPAARLPDVTDTVTIDGTAEAAPPGALPTIRLSGESGAQSGLRLVNAPGSVVRGLTFIRFSQTAIEVVRGDGVVIEGNRIGVDGNLERPNGTGIHLSAAHGCRIGGPADVQRNVISSNAIGVRIDSPQ